MIQPINSHLIIEPIVHDSFIASQKDQYDEIGVIVAFDQYLQSSVPDIIRVGDKVYFDSWLAARYPKEGGNPDEYYWLVKWEDIRAIDYVEPPLSE